METIRYGGGPRRHRRSSCSDGSGFMGEAVHSATLSLPGHDFTRQHKLRHWQDLLLVHTAGSCAFPSDAHGSRSFLRQNFRYLAQLLQHPFTPGTQPTFANVLHRMLSSQSRCSQHRSREPLTLLARTDITKRCRWDVSSSACSYLIIRCAPLPYHATLARAELTILAAVYSR